ncbi:MAG: DNA ligase D [Proteobacteria bacterium]|nr:MAG: DNA ligase D [Pseudomonadota bacterium]
MGLDEYRRKRDFTRTREPRGAASQRAPDAPGQFVVQQHAARRMHYDFRLELDGVLKSWAVPKGPSLVPGDRRMAVETEDHPLDYATFEGVIPKGEYGGGTVVVWDRGTWHPIGDPHAGLAAGKLDFELAGEKLRGAWHMVRLAPRSEDRGKTSWLLMKRSDAHARPATAGSITAAAPRSVLSGRTLEEVARDADRVWSSTTGERDAPAIPRPGDPSAVPGARRAALPRRIAPQLATLADAAPDGDEWLHEIKFDGYRLLCRLEEGEAQLVTRAGNDWTDRFPGLARAVAALPVESALFDGEAVVLDAHGRSDFQQMQGALGQDRPDLVLYAFDLLWLDGWDLREAPLVERKRLLRWLLARAPDRSPLRYSDHVRGRGPDFHAEACRNHLEGIVAKRADAPYRSLRTRAWLKVKCSRRQEFAVVGFTDPAGSRVGFGALLLGAKDAEGRLRYCGRVGTGFDDKTLASLHAALAGDEIAKPPVVGAPRARGLHWVTPRLVAEVSFTEWTRDGVIRHPSFLGLRADKRPDEVTIEVADPPPPAAAPVIRAEVAGVRLSNPDRVYWPELGITKSELAQYYERVADRMLPGIAERPLTLRRCPEGWEGECFYQKHATESVPASVPRVDIEPGKEPYTMVRDLASLVALVQIATLEFHVWGARADRLDRPDILVFDLDPDAAVPWRRLADTALVLRAFLGELGLVPFVRGTGGKGLHVVVPIERRATWDEAKRFTHAVALALVREAPRHFTAQLSKARRAGKIFIDYLRNDAEATAIASYSTRSRAGAPVAMPLFWEELGAAEGPPQWSLREAPARLNDADPWAEFDASRRLLSRATLRRLGVE